MVFNRLGRMAARHALIVVIVWVVIAGACLTLAFVGIGGKNLFDRLSTGEPVIPGSQSSQATAILNAEQQETVSTIVNGVNAKDPALVTAMAPVNAKLGGIDGVDTVIDAYLPSVQEDPKAAAALIAPDAKSFIVSVTIKSGLGAKATSAAATAAEDELAAVPRAVAAAVPSAKDATGVVSSTQLVVDDITTQVRQDLATGEAISLPIALLVMVLVFGGFLAAAMPLAGALASIAAGLGTLFGITHAINVDASVVNVVTLVGLGLSIDYGLLIVSRFREELRRALDNEAPGRLRGRRDPVVAEALERTMGTAGRTVTFSALTVAISVSALIVFTPEVLRSIGAAGAAIVLIAVATALTLVPALLALTGRRLARPPLLDRVPVLRSILRHTADVRSDEGAFSRLAARVEKRPVWVFAGVLIVLVVLALPVFSLQLRNSGVELLPTSSPQRQFSEQLRTDYPALASPDVIIVAQTSADTAQAWASSLGSLDGVKSVSAAAPVGAYEQIGVNVASTDPGGKTAISVVKEIRGQSPGFQYWVTGQAASQLDFTQALLARIWWAVAIVVVAGLVLLFLMTGSVAIPIKALITNAISLSASLGLLVWVFQYGHLERLLDYSSTGGIETWVIAIVIAFAFGLAMDYEVFLLSRVKELHDAGHSNSEALRIGLQRSGRIITSAAAVIVFVFIGFIFGKLLIIKEVGFALAVAVVVDATLVRLLLVPATMTLLGRFNWWAPRPLQRVYEKLKITH